MYKEFLTKTKLVCTLGPATESPQILREMILLGVNVFRLNFSHGKYEKFKELIVNIRQQAAKCGTEVCILADLQGPKIRAGTFPSGSMNLIDGQTVTIRWSHESGGDSVITTDFNQLFSDGKNGDKILIDDGKIELQITKINDAKDSCLCKVVHGGVIKDHKGINLPNTELNIPALTEKDIKDLEFILEQDIDAIALSFVRKPQDVQELKKRVQEKKPYVQIISKLEKPEAIHNMQAIIMESDAVMIARGDLGVEIGNHKVPSLQKKIIQCALTCGVPVITATQMLESMINCSTPTRAEASDVANAIFDGTDAVMLSAETSVGQFPLETIKTMKKIIQDAESHELEFEIANESSIAHKIKYLQKKYQQLDSSSSHLGMQLGKSACILSYEVGAKALACFSHSGNAAIRLAAQRPSSPIYMLSNRLSALRRMCLVRGTWGIEIDLSSADLTTLSTSHSSSIFALMEKALKEKDFIKSGDYVVYTAGLPTLAEASTNTIHIKQHV